MPALSECRLCHGKGHVEDVLDALTNWIAGAEDFPCEKCPRCKGSGKEPRQGSYEDENFF